MSMPFITLCRHFVYATEFISHRLQYYNQLLMRALCVGVIHAYPDHPLSAKLMPLLTVLIAATKSNPNLSSIQTHALYVVLSCKCRSTVSYDCPLHAYHLKYRRLRGDMIEVFKITHNIYDTTVSPDLTFNERANTRGNHYKQQNHTFHCDLRKHFFLRSL